MNDFEILREQWNKATGNLLYGEQAMFHTVLELVKDEQKTNLIYGSDYSPEGVCLVNAAGNTLAVGGGHGVPMASYGPLVSLYDQINREFKIRSINTDNHVSPLAAEILLQWFAPLKDAPVANDLEAFAQNTEVYIEPDDTEVMQDLIKFLSEDEASLPTEVQTPFDIDVDANQ